MRPRRCGHEMDKDKMSTCVQGAEAVDSLELLDAPAAPLATAKGTSFSTVQIERSPVVKVVLMYDF